MDVAVGLENFRVWGLRGGGQRALVLDELVEQVTWNDDDPVLTASVQLRIPDGMSITDLPLGAGNEVKLGVSLTGSAPYPELWRLRVQGPSKGMMDGTVTLDCRADLGLLADSEDVFKFVRNHEHPRGWLVHEAVTEVCSRYGVRVVLPATRYHIRKLIWQESNGSVLDLITRLFLIEKQNEGKRFVMRWRKGRLEVLPLRRASHMLELGPAILDATYQAAKGDGFLTAATLHSTVTQTTGKNAKGHRKAKQRKITAELTAPNRIEKYGFTHRILYVRGADTVQELARLGRIYMAKHGQLTRTISLTHPGVPYLRRGDAMRVVVPDENLEFLVYVQSVTHTVTPSDYTMQVACVFDDPFIDVKLDRVAETLEEVSASKSSKGTKKKKKKTNKNEDTPTAKIPRVPKPTPGQRLSGRFAP